MSKSKNNNNVAIIFDDLTEFFVMRPAIDDMKKAKINVDIIVPYDSGYNGLSEYTFKEIVKLGYHPLKDAPKDKEAIESANCIKLKIRDARLYNGNVLANIGAIC